ncbi:MAG: hypothetical protein ACXWNW_14185 [Isosphaeraceae bacterium]
MNPPIGHGRTPHHAVIQPMPAPLDVIAVVSNPVRYRSRYDLFRAFEAHAKESGARLTVVEMAFGNRPFEVTDATESRHIQVRSDMELWQKENLINIGVSRLPADARYIAWIDADLTFARPDWVQETIQQLQHYPVVQMFSEAHDLGPDGTVVNSFRSFGYSHVHGVPRKKGGGRGDYGGIPETTNARIAYWHHPGFAWAARREAIDLVGGLFDVAVVGEADYIMAKSLVGEAADVLYPGVSPGYRKAVLDWQSQALKLNRNFGYVPGTVLHHWHGRKANRNYWDRCKILTDTQFDPTTDLRRDSQGLWKLVDHGDARTAKLRDAIRAYFRARNEDGIEL